MTKNKEKAMTRNDLLVIFNEVMREGRTELDLIGQGISELPPEIGRLKNLKTLNLGIRYGKEKTYKNQLYELPAEIGQLTNLQRLDFSGNRLVSLPESIGKLINL